MPLPVNVDTTYADDGGDASVKTHQQHHDIVHGAVNKIESVLVVAATGATEALDLAAYGTFDLTMDVNCTISFINPPSSGLLGSWVLIIRGAFTPTLPASVKFPDGVAPTYTTPSWYVLSTVDGGTSYLLAQIAKAVA